MSPLFLLRHGPTQAHGQGAPLGRMDLPVTEEGQRLWPRVKEELLALEPAGGFSVLTSGLRRAGTHARDLGRPCRALAELDEQDFGAWDGRPWAEIREAGAFFADPVQAAPPGGESFAQCAGRVLGPVLEALGERPGPVLILAHGGPLRILLAHFLGLSLDRALDLAWGPFGLTRLDRYAEGRAVLGFHNRILPSGSAPGIL